jgi:hypothetical protein
MNDKRLKLGEPMSPHRLLTILAFILVMPIGLPTASAQSSYVANTAPPDAFLALKTYPSGNSPRIMAMANGTKLDVLLRRGDGWWFVKVSPTGEQGWAFSGSGNKAYILCCGAPDGSQTEVEPVVKDLADYDCDQLWFGRNSVFKEAGYCFKTQRAIAAFGNAGCRYDDVSVVILTLENQSFVQAAQNFERAKSCPR